MLHNILKLSSQQDHYAGPGSIFLMKAGLNGQNKSLWWELITIFICSL